MNTKNYVTILLTLMIALSMVLTGCGSKDNTNNTPQKTEAPKTETTKPTQAASKDKQQVEIFSWWTGAGEEDGLKALIQLFKDKHSDIEVINAAVAGGAGTNAKAVLASRMQGGDPPGTFQVHGGAELNTGWVAAGKMENLNDLYAEEGWNEKFPKDLIDLVSKDGNVYSVPVNIHRGNVLWYNKAIFDDNNLKAPTTFDEFFAVADALVAKGITPLALGDKEPWTAVHLFEDVLLGTLGADGYKGLFNGGTKWDDAKVVQSLEIFKKMMTYVNKDHAARNWQDATQLVASGDAAMNVMGDWAKGYLKNDLKLEPNVGFGFEPTPGTQGMFMIVADTFGLPKGGKDPESVKEFLKVLGSVEGQDAFNPLKGSIPARIDADPNKYDVYGQSTMNDFKAAKLAPSIAHGSAAPEGFNTEISDMITIFVTKGDVDQAVNTLVKSAEANNMSK